MSEQELLTDEDFAKHVEQLEIDETDEAEDALEHEVDDE